VLTDDSSPGMQDMAEEEEEEEGLSLVSGKCYVEEILQLRSSRAADRVCINCRQVEPSYICLDFCTFICEGCSDVHREFGHKIKSIEHSEWTAEEVKDLEQGGNERATHKLLQFMPSSDSRAVELTETFRRDFIRRAYIVRCWQQQPEPASHCTATKDAIQDCCEEAACDGAHTPETSSGDVEQQWADFSSDNGSADAMHLHPGAQEATCEHGPALSMPAAQSHQIPFTTSVWDAALAIEETPHNRSSNESPSIPNIPSTGPLLSNEGDEAQPPLSSFGAYPCVETKLDLQWEADFTNCATSIGIGDATTDVPKSEECQVTCLVDNVSENAVTSASTLGNNLEKPEAQAHCNLDLLDDNINQIPDVPKHEESHDSSLVESVAKRIMPSSAPGTVVEKPEAKPHCNLDLLDDDITQVPDLPKPEGHQAIPENTIMLASAPGSLVEKPEAPVHCTFDLLDDNINEVPDVPKPEESQVTYENTSTPALAPGKVDEKPEAQVHCTLDLLDGNINQVPDVPKSEESPVTSENSTTPAPAPGKVVEKPEAQVHCTLDLLDGNINQVPDVPKPEESQVTSENTITPAPAQGQVVKKQEAPVHCTLDLLDDNINNTQYEDLLDFGEPEVHTGSATATALTTADSSKDQVQTESAIAKALTGSVSSKEPETVHSDDSQFASEDQATTISDRLRSAVMTGSTNTLLGLFKECEQIAKTAQQARTEALNSHFAALDELAPSPTTSPRDVHKIDGEEQELYTSPCTLLNQRCETALQKTKGEDSIREDLLDLDTSEPDLQKLQDCTSCRQATPESQPILFTASKESVMDMLVPMKGPKDGMEMGFERAEDTTSSNIEFGDLLTVFQEKNSIGPSKITL